MWRLDLKKKKRAYHEEEKQQQAKLHLKVKKDSTRSNIKERDSLTTNTVKEGNNEHQEAKNKGAEAIRKIPDRPSLFRNDSISDSEKSEESVRLERLSSMVFMTSKELELKYTDSFSSRSSNRSRRRIRKTRSEGVKDMVMMGSDLKDMIPSSSSDASSRSSMEKAKSPTTMGSTQPQRRERKWRKKAVSSGVDFMRSVGENAKEMDKSKLDKGKSKGNKIGKKSSIPKSSSSGALPALLEDIPSRNEDAHEIVIPVGRQHRNNNASLDFNKSSESPKDPIITVEHQNDDKAPHEIKIPVGRQHHNSNASLDFNKSSESPTKGNNNASLDFNKSLTKEDSKDPTITVENQNDDKDVDLPIVTKKLEDTKLAPSSSLSNLSSFLSGSHYRVASFAFGSMVRLISII